MSKVSSVMRSTSPAISLGSNWELAKMGTPMSSLFLVARSMRLCSGPRIFSNVSLDRQRATLGVSAVMLAPRGTFLSKACSPKKSPGP